MKKPKVSIVIPVYNGENYMREAIDSALAQTYENCEVIVVNDGSIDHTEEIAKSYGDRIKYFSKSNGGVSTALNVGIEHMTGEYFCYLPHDDIFHPDKVKIQMDAILKSGDEMSIVWSGWNYYYSKSGQRKKAALPIWSSKRNVIRGVYPLFFGLVNTVTVMLSKKYFEIVGKFDPLLYTSQDYDMWFRTFRMHDTIYIDQELVDYRIHDLQGTEMDPEYMRNCQEMAMKMLTQVTVDEIEHAFASEYAFYYGMVKYYAMMEWQSCLEYAKSKFAAASEPKDADYFRTKLKNDLYEIASSDKIVLYGAGGNGKRLLRDLQSRGIDIFAWCDSDMSKHGKEIEGQICMSPKELKEAHCLTIVTIDEPEELKKELKAQGVQYVTDYYEIADMIYRTLPEYVEM